MVDHEAPCRCFLWARSCAKSIAGFSLFKEFTTPDGVVAIKEVRQVDNCIHKLSASALAEAVFQHPTSKTYPIVEASSKMHCLMTSSLPELVTYRGELMLQKPHFKRAAATATPGRNTKRINKLRLRALAFTVSFFSHFRGKARYCETHPIATINL